MKTSHDTTSLEKYSNGTDNLSYEASVSEYKSKFNVKTRIIQERGRELKSVNINCEEKVLKVNMDGVYEDAKSNLASKDFKPSVDFSSDDKLPSKKSNRSKRIAYYLSLAEKISKENELQENQINAYSSTKKECLKLEAPASTRNSVVQVHFMNKQQNKPCSGIHSPSVSCKCDTCFMWKSNYLSGPEMVFADEKQKEQTIVIKPPLLLKEEKENKNESIVIKSQSIHSLTITQQVFTPTILVHG